MDNFETIPLFPLHTVLFPGGNLSLRIFESRYLDMIVSCLRGNTGFGVCLIRSGSEVGRAADFFSTGTYARIIHWEQHRDGILGIEILGELRFRVTQHTVNTSQLVSGRIKWLKTGEPAGVPAAYASLRSVYQKLSARLNYRIASGEKELDDADWLGYRLAELLPLSPAARQELLEMDDCMDRLDRLHNMTAE